MSSAVSDGRHDHNGPSHNRDLPLDASPFDVIGACTQDPHDDRHRRRHEGNLPRLPAALAVCPRRRRDAWSSTTMTAARKSARKVN